MKFAAYRLPVIFGQTDLRSSRTVSLRQLSFLLLKEDDKRRTEMLR